MSSGACSDGDEMRRNAGHVLVRKGLHASFLLHAGGPYQLQARSNKGIVRMVNDVWVGEVWLLSGQSVRFVLLPLHQQTGKLMLHTVCGTAAEDRCCRRCCRRCCVPCITPATEQQGSCLCELCDSGNCRVHALIVVDSSLSHSYVLTSVAQNMILSLADIALTQQQPYANRATADIAAAAASPAPTVRMYQVLRKSSPNPGKFTVTPHSMSHRL